LQPEISPGICVFQGTVAGLDENYKGCAMSQVYLLRHAKAVWPSPSQKDFDRVLDKDGIKAAEVLGKELRRSGLKPEIVLCSPAIRARQTLEYVDIEPPFILEESEKLYSAGPDAYLMAIRLTGLKH
jgi:phosphohistidine phosphatase